MSYIHDVIKIRLSQLGYLPDTPYHLISDEEMCNAFIGNDASYFFDYYPCNESELSDEYATLVSAIRYHVSQMIQSADENAKLPDWVYSYMLGAVIGPMSDPMDIHDLILPLGVDNIDDIFDSNAMFACLAASKKWLMKIKRVDVQLPDGSILNTRPPTMFGEPHVVKYVRLEDLRPSLSGE